MEQTTYFDPDAKVVEPRHLIPKHKPFKPLRNVKTGNFFSYSFPVIFRNRSSNSDNEIVWVTDAPDHIQEKIDKIREMHEQAVRIHAKREQADKERNVSKVKELTTQFEAIMADIDEVIYPKAEREYVESAQSQYLKEKESREMKLDKESLTALRGEEPGSTADTAVLEAKLKLAEEKLKAMEAEKPVKPAPRKKAAKPEPEPAPEIELPTAQ